MSIFIQKKVNEKRNLFKIRKLKEAIYDYKICKQQIAYLKNDYDKSTKEQRAQLQRISELEKQYKPIFQDDEELQTTVEKTLTK